MSSRPAADTGLRGLRALARAYGIVTEYVDMEGTERAASPEALVAALEALGVDAARPTQLEDALWERQQTLHMRLVEPVAVAWEGEAPVVELNLALPERGHRIECRLTTEQGDEVEWATVDARVELPEDLPRGYHDLEVAVGERRASCRVIRAPRTAWDPEERAWGVFLPLYALRTRSSWGTGDLSGLFDLCEWTGDLGGSVVATLPLLAAFLDRPFDPSPYAPVSRLFWNELYVDPAAAPELERSGEARTLLESTALREEIRELRRGGLVDYRAAGRLKRRVLDALARTFFADGEPGWRSEPFLEFLAERPEARTYARFRAACELQERPWREWAPRMRGGELEAGDFAEPAARTHLYAQWLARRQLDGIGEGEGAGLLLDLPLGVHPDGFDAWRWPELFVEGVSTGAPPDDFFRHGQDWGFPPLHPQRVREDGYRYPAAVLRTLCRHASAVRIDHVMAFHRLFWVPRGMEAEDGVYVRYRPEEWWAVACLESRRHETAIVGEDLGTVPPEVRDAIERHRARRTWIVPAALEEDPPALEEPPELSVAAVATHDMPTFAAWWEGMPGRRRAALIAALEAAGALDPAAMEEVPESQRARPVLEALLRRMSDGRARLVSINLEDLWLESEPQNVPGTSMEERPNWRRRARFRFELFCEMPEVTGPLAEVDRHRDEEARAP